MMTRKGRKVQARWMFSSLSYPYLPTGVQDSDHNFMWIHLSSKWWREICLVCSQKVLIQIFAHSYQLKVRKSWRWEGTWIFIFRLHWLWRNSKNREKDNQGPTRNTWSPHFQNQLQQTLHRKKLFFILPLPQKGYCAIITSSSIATAPLSFPW